MGADDVQRIGIPINAFPIGTQFTITSAFKDGSGDTHHTETLNWVKPR